MEGNLPKRLKYQCDLCEFSCDRIALMDRHVKNNHVDLDDQSEEFDLTIPPSSPLKSRSKIDRSSVKDYDDEWEELESTPHRLLP